jgi:hypothetical protein
MWIYLLILIEISWLQIPCPNYKYCDAYHYQKNHSYDTLRYCEREYALKQMKHYEPDWMGTSGINADGLPTERSIKFDSMWVGYRSSKHGNPLPSNMKGETR